MGCGDYKTNLALATRYTLTTDYTVRSCIEDNMFSYIQSNIHTYIQVHL